MSGKWSTTITNAPSAANPAYVGAVLYNNSSCSGTGVLSAPRVTIQVTDS
jgi:hypothetical protein